jgi:hypothetical protein
VDYPERAFLEIGAALVARSGEEHAMTTKTNPEPAVPENTRPECLCGCGGTPRGKNARFLPGHDARFHAAQKKAAVEAAPVTPVPASAPDRPARAAKSRAVKDGTSETAGSKA